MVVEVLQVKIAFLRGSSRLVVVLENTVLQWLVMAGTVSAIGAEGIV